MSNSNVDNAKVKMSQVLSQWLDETGAIVFASSWHNELLSILEEAVDAGAEAYKLDQQEMFDEIWNNFMGSLHDDT